MQTTRLKGLTIAALGVLFIVPDALLVKITSVEPVVFLFWRGLLLAFSFSCEELCLVLLVFGDGFVRSFHLDRCLLSRLGLL